MKLEYAKGDASLPRMRAMNRAWTVFLWIFFGALLLIGGMMILWAASPAELLVLVFLSRSIQLQRRRRGASVLAVVHQAVRLNLPIPEVLNAAARDEKGKYRRRLNNLSVALANGQSLEQALTVSVPEISEADVRKIAASQKIGQLEGCLARLIEAIRPRGVGAVELAGIYLIYPMFVIAVFWVPSVFVMPKLIQIFQDFNLPLPWPAQMMVWLSDSPYLLGICGILALIVGLGFLGQCLTSFWRPPRRRSPFDGAWMDRITWRIPTLHGLIRDRGMAEMCDYLAKSVEMGRPFDEAVFDATATQTNAVLRYRVGEWGRLIFDGMPIGQAAASAGLPSIIAGMFASARDSEGIFQVLSFLSRYYESRYDKLREVLAAMYLPAMVLLMGGLVAVLGLSLFQPLAELTKNLTPGVRGF